MAERGKEIRTKPYIAQLIELREKCFRTNDITLPTNTKAKRKRTQTDHIRTENSTTPENENKRCNRKKRYEKPPTKNMERTQNRNTPPQSKQNPENAKTNRQTQKNHKGETISIKTLNK